MKKVLVVDDSKTILFAIKAQFSSFPNIDVLYAENYAETKRIVNEYKDDIGVALLDFNLPDAPNGEVISLVNSYAIPTIVLTGLIGTDVRNSLKEKEIINYILKDKSTSIELAVKSIMSILENSHKKILIVDDSKLQRMELAMLLQKSNLDIIEAENGEEALAILNDKTQDISLVITDQEMPIMDGVELTIKAREIYDKNELGILAISSSGDVKSINEFLTFGANDFIQKPLNPIEITAKVNLNLGLIKMFNKISDMANKDYMTGAYNRRYFFESAKSVFLKAKRNKKPLVIAMLDIDKFKTINDTYGHHVGDVAIKEVKRVLDTTLRASDLVARFGGEEFCILLEDISIEDTKKLFEKIRHNFEKNVIDIQKAKITYTVSFGVAYGMSDTIEDMINLSDEALYDSKENGRNQVTLKITD